MLRGYSQEQLRAIAHQARDDFEHGLIPNDEIREKARLYGFNEKRLSSVMVSGVKNSPFPNGWCMEAAVILKSRTDDAKLLEENYESVIVEGGYNVDSSEYDEPHNFLAIGAVGRFVGMFAVSKYIFMGDELDNVFTQNIDIADISADQFGGPSVYIGNLTSPWALGFHSPYEVI